MKTISVKEAAEALGVSPRAVQYKLQNGDLKGTRTKNQYGVAEWRVWPNKEITEAISRKRGSNEEGPGDVMSFSPSEMETVEAQEVVYNEDAEVEDDVPNWRQVEIERLELMAEKLVKPLTERIEAQAIALREQENILEDQRRQLRLLPDLQKQAETERKAAELGALENEALKKQIEALQLEQHEANEAKKQLDELERTLAENQRKAEEEIERLKREREADAKAIEELRAVDEAKLAEKEAQAAEFKKQLEALTATVEELKTPKPSWWQRWFSAPQETA